MRKIAVGNTYWRSLRQACRRLDKIECAYNPAGNCRHTLFLPFCGETARNMQGGRGRNPPMRFLPHVLWKIGFSATVLRQNKRIPGKRERMEGLPVGAKPAAPTDTAGSYQRRGWRRSPESDPGAACRSLSGGRRRRPGRQGRCRQCPPERPVHPDPAPPLR